MAQSESSESASPNKKHWWQKQIYIPPRWFWHRQIYIPTQVQLILCLLGIIATWLTLFFMGDPPSAIVGLLVYLVFWSLVGSLIGFALSKNRDRGLFLGAIVGAVLAAVLMC